MLNTIYIPIPNLYRILSHGAIRLIDNFIMQKQGSVTPQDTINLTALDKILPVDISEDAEFLYIKISHRGGCGWIRAAKGKLQ